MSLTDAKIRTLKSTASVQKLSDGHGLQLWVSPAGNRVWHLAYRFDGKQKKLTIGGYPEFGLSDARKQRDEARALLARGIDPTQQKKLSAGLVRAGRKNTFAALAAELLEKKRREGKASNTIGKREWLYGLAGDDFGKRPIADITAQEILRALQVVERKGLLETARRMRSSIGEVFRFAVATGRATTDPTFALRGALAKPIVKHRAAITDPQELGGLLRAVEAYKGQPTTVAALKLMALLFVRPGMMRFARWDEFDFDKAVWSLSAERMKMRRPHRIPLAPQALAIIEGLRPITGHTEFLFPGIISVKRPISENTMNVSLRRMGFGADEMTSHGFRAAASTLLNESGKFSADAIERALAHQDKDAIRRIYARGEYWDERVEMAAWWADRLDTLRDGAKVMPFKRA